MVKRQYIKILKVRNSNLDKIKINVEKFISILITNKKLKELGLILLNPRLISLRVVKALKKSKEYKVGCCFIEIAPNSNRLRK